ncbi:PQQ-dependent sugar dehydrogenase [Nocardia sp. NPDC024068]|uniref:PQQ-dependent sugar dehydrogenase n=1 Tax=Nocardia sp. NPDC024068 TaxID=3157197 RepID=UPI0033FDDB35
MGVRWPRIRLSGTFAAAVVLATALVACSDETAETPGSSSKPHPAPAVFGATSVVTDRLAAPWSIAFHGGVALIGERDSARVLELDARGGTRAVATIPGVAGTGEGGMLGIAVRDGNLYVYSTTPDGNRLQRYPLTGQPGSLGIGPGETLLNEIASARYHNGGRIAFGPDGMLYATVGDAGDRASAQDRNALTGKILRMTPEGRVPRDNPFPGSLVYSYGHRNPQGIGWAADGTLYASEFGQDTWDELNIIEAGGNYGWPEVEGAAGRPEFIDPVQQWEPAVASPSGVAVTEDALFVANLRGERLREIPLSDPSVSAEHLAGEYGRLRDVVTAPDGALWVLTNNTDGRGDPRPGDDRVLRIVPGR